MKKRSFRIGGAALLLGMGAIALAVFAWPGKETALAEFNVQNLTCGSCAANIREALAGVRGIGEVEVSVTSGRARVQFEPAVIAAEGITERISAAGYPARLTEVFTPAEIKALNENAARLADKYVARIGDRLVSREEFAAEVDRLRGRVPNGQNLPEGRLQQLVWQEKLERELVLADAESRMVVVQDGEVALEIDRMRQANPDYEAQMAQQFGGEASFTRLLKEQLIIQRHIEENVLQGEKDPGRRQATIGSWYRGLMEAHPVTIFDPGLKAAVQKSGGCGGSCCS